MKSFTLGNSSPRIEFAGWETLQRGRKNGSEERKVQGSQQGSPDRAADAEGAGPGGLLSYQARMGSQTWEE